MIVAPNLHDTHGICITWVDLLFGRGQHSCGTVRLVRRRWMRSMQECLTAGRMRRLQRSTPRSMLHANGTSCATGMAPFTSTWCSPIHSEIEAGLIQIAIAQASMP